MRIGRNNFIQLFLKRVICMQSPAQVRHCNFFVFLLQMQKISSKDLPESPSLSASHLSQKSKNFLGFVSSVASVFMQIADFLHRSLANYKQLLEYSRKSGSPELQMHMHLIMRIHEEGRRTSVLVVLFLAAVIPVFRHLQSLRNDNMITPGIPPVFHTIHNF